MADNFAKLMRLGRNSSLYLVELVERVLDIRAVFLNEIHMAPVEEDLETPEFVQWNWSMCLCYRDIAVAERREVERVHQGKVGHDECSCRKRRHRSVLHGISLPIFFGRLPTKTAHKLTRF